MSLTDEQVALRRGKDSVKERMTNVEYASEQMGASPVKIPGGRYNLEHPMHDSWGRLQKQHLFSQKVADDVIDHSPAMQERREIDGDAEIQMGAVAFCIMGILTLLLGAALYAFLQVVIDFAQRWIR